MKKTLVFLIMLALVASSSGCRLFHKKKKQEYDSASYNPIKWNSSHYPKTSTSKGGEESNGPPPKSGESNTPPQTEDPTTGESRSRSRNNFEIETNRTS